MQCEKEEFVELLENLDQNETNFDYNTGKSLAELGSYRLFYRFYSDIYHPERMEENMYI